METYGKDPDATLHEVARDTVLLLRALNHRLHHFQAQILADIKIRESYNRNRSQPQTGITPRMRDRHCTRTTLMPPMRASQPEYAHTTDADEQNNPPPVWRPARNEESRPNASRSAINTMSNKTRSLDENRNYPRPTGQIHQEVQPTSEIDVSFSTNPVDQSESSPETEITTTTRHEPQISEHTNYNQNPSTPRPQHADAKTSRKPQSPPDDSHTATIRDTAIHNENSPTTRQTELPAEEKKYEARLFRQNKERDTSEPETKLDTRYAPYQRGTIIRPHATANREEFRTNRDVSLVPDRGKELNETVTTGIKREEPPPELNDFCMYK